MKKEFNFSRRDFLKKGSLAACYAYAGGLPVQLCADPTKLYLVDALEFPTVFSDHFDGRTAEEIYAEWKAVRYRVAREQPVTEEGWLKVDWDPDISLGYAFRVAYRNARYAFDVKTSASDRSDLDAHAVVVLRTLCGGSRYGSIASGQEGRGAGVGLHIFNAERRGEVSLIIADAAGEVLSKAPSFHLPIPQGVNFLRSTHVILYDLDDRLLVFADNQPLAAIQLGSLATDGYYTSGRVYDATGRLAGSFNGTRVARDSAFAFTLRNTDLQINNLSIGRKFSPAVSHEPVFASVLYGTPHSKAREKLPIRIEVAFKDGGRGLFKVDWQDLNTVYGINQPGTHLLQGQLSSPYHWPVELGASAQLTVSKPLPAMPEGKTVVYQLQPEPNNLHMGYVIRTRTGRLIVVDGGGQTQTSEPTFHLLSTLQEISGEEHPVIDAWFLTHPHHDHIGEFTRIGLEAPDSITVRAIYCNFPPRDWIELREDIYFLERFPHLLDNFSKAFNALMGERAWETYEGIERGEMVVVDDVTFDILQVPDKRKRQFARSPVNNTSMIFRMTAEGQTLLFLGDLAVEGGKILVQTYGDHLQSDMVQMSHHGQGGVDREVYRLIDPQLCFWPTPQWLWETTHPSFQTQITRGWMRELGIDNHLVAGLLGLYAVPLPFDLEAHRAALNQAR